MAALCPGAPLVHGAFPLGSSLESSLTATPYIFLFIVGVRKLYVNHGTTHQQPDFNHLGTGLAGANFFSINLNHPGWRMLAPVKLGWCHVRRVLKFWFCIVFVFFFILLSLLLKEL